MKKPLLILLLVCCLTGEQSFCAVDVSAPIDSYWGYNRDAELQISVNVTTDNDDWENIIVSVTTPDDRIFPTTTEDSGNQTTKTYSYTIKSLYIGEAGIYTFTATNIQNNTLTDSENVTVYIYTVDANPLLAQRVVSERDKSFTTQIYVTTDASWDDVTVTLHSPTGNLIPTEVIPTTFPFWRIYTAEVNEIVAGSYNFTVQETLGGETYTIIPQVVVEIYGVTDLDEYLYRFGLLTNITESVSNFYRYLYDAPENNYILDGGKDMYDRGNYISLSSTTSMEMDVPYGKPFMFPTFSFSSKAMYPFSSLLWISNEDKADNMFSIRVNGRTGSAGFGSSEQISGKVNVSNYDLMYMVYQVYDDIDPSICEVYFTISNTEVWSSVLPATTEMIDNGFAPTSLDHTFVVTGEIQNVMLGYTLLSKPEGEKILQSEVENALTSMLLVIEERDGFSISSPSTIVADFEQNVTISVRITTPGDWADTEVSVKTPSNQTTVLTEYTTDGEARIFFYAIQTPTTIDNGIYVFYANDMYETVITSQTELTVIVAEMSVSEPEYWAVVDDEQLIISVNVIANIWDDIAVQVIAPNTTVYFANTTSNDDRMRTYTHVITDLSKDDVGVYTFTVLEDGRIGSESVQVTVYLFSMKISPEHSNYRVTDRDRSLTMSVYVISEQRNWDNIQVMFHAPGASEVTGENQINYADENMRQYSADVQTVGMSDTYDITAMEIVAGKSYPLTVTSRVEVVETNIVDEYLYRISVYSVLILENIPGFYKYWYDSPNNSYIADGGNDMYDGGNFVSFGSSSEMQEDILYGQPLETKQAQFSSKQTYPFVSLMWIDNTNQTEESFHINVRGQASTRVNAALSGFTFSVSYRSYEIFYQVAQTHSTANPSICEVYFTVTNTEVWNSVIKERLTVNFGGVPPLLLNNTATLSRYPSNVMLGYALFSKSNGGQLIMYEVELVMEQFAAAFAEKDGFTIAPTQGGEPYESVAGESVVLSVYVDVDIDWGGVKVEVMTPSSIEEVTDYDALNFQNRREYKYTINNPSYSDVGTYTFIATDKYRYQIMQTTYLYVYTTTIEASQTALNANQNQQSLELSVLVSTDADWDDVSVMIEGPSGLEDTVDDFTSNINNRRTYVYRISDVNAQNDAGSYVFTATERWGEKSAEMTSVIEVSVFSLSLSAPLSSLTTDEGTDALQISVTATSFGDWNDVIISVSTPSRGRQSVTEYQGQGNSRTYIYTMRDVTMEDAGSYEFTGTETLNGETMDSDVMIEIVVKEAKLSPGEIAGIVIGSIAGAAIIIGLLIYCVKSNKKQKSKFVSDITLPEKSRIPEKEDVEYSKEKTKF